MEGTVLGNRYELLDRVGMGGMAIVYKAKDKMLNRFVAVKVLREEFKENEEFIRRFNVESQAAAILSHQNIVQIYDVGEENGIHYIVMELLEGMTLKAYMNEREENLTWREAANFSMQICRALDHAHSKHVVHRDIKPQNIILAEGGKLKVADFGIARAANNSTTVNSKNAAVGSAHYLSPEQARGGYTDRRSDIYSMGIVMYEMFTGKLPFDADDGVAVIMQHLHENAVPPCEVNPALPKGIEAIIVKAMNKEQRLRYENAKDIIEDLIAVYQNPDIKVSELHAGGSDIVSQASGARRERDEAVAAKRREKIKKRKKQKKRRNILTVISLVFLIIVMLIGYGGYLLFSGTGDEVLIPDLTGLTYEEAIEAANEAGTDSVKFTVIVDRQEYNDEKKDCIISQVPGEGSSVKRSREIKVVLSLGPVMLELDDYTGEKFETVKKLLEDNGIKVIKKEEESDKYDEGIITRHNPKEGTQMGEGDEITVYVSKGTTNTVVPNVVGKTLEEAIIAIERNDLKVGTVKKEAKEGYDKDRVFRQSEDAFDTVPIDTVIDLYVSTGEKIEKEEKPDDEKDDTADDKSQTGTAGSENPEEPSHGSDKTDATPQKPSGNEPSHKNVKLTFNGLPTDREKVSIRLVNDGHTFYEKEFSTQDGSATVSVDITESLSLDVYYDGVYITTKEVKY